MVPPERLSVFNDCTLTGIKHIVAKRKLQSMVRGTQLVRDALTGIAEPWVVGGAVATPTTAWVIDCSANPATIRPSSAPASSGRL